MDELPLVYPRASDSMDRRMFSVTRCASSMLFLVAIATANSSAAQNPSGSIGDLASQGHAGTAVTPVYGQLVMFSYPPGFTPAHAKDAGTQYIQEYVLEGETVEKWSQMVTLTGAKGLAANQEVTPPQPPRIDGEKWLARLKQLYPIKLCARVPNEPAPYPSCINQK